MVANTQSTSPTFFNFLKEGLLLPTHNRRLFAAIFATIVASTSLLSLGSYLAIQPLADEIRVDTNALNSTNNPSSPKSLHLHQESKDDTRGLSVTGMVWLLVPFIIKSVIEIIVHFAAVATYSGEVHTFASLLGKAKAQMKGPIFTLVFVHALEMITFIPLAVPMGGLLAFLMIKQYNMALVTSVCTVFITVTFTFLISYFSFLRSLSIVVAVAEPGCHCAAAVRRAWRMMKGKKLLRAVLFIVVTVVLPTAFWPVDTLAKKCALSNMAAGLLLGFLYTVLMSAVQVFEVCTMAAFYYECKGSTEASATEYIKVSKIDV